MNFLMFSPFYFIICVLYASYQIISLLWLWLAWSRAQPVLADL